MKFRPGSFLAAMAIFSAILLHAPAASAEQPELRIAKQYGLGYLQMMVLEDKKLVEKHAKAAGLGDVELSWLTFRSSDVMNDAIISGNVDFVSLGVPGLAVIWSKTQGTANAVKAASGMNLLPLALMTRNPDVKSLKDFGAKDKIAVPAIKVSTQAILLHMAAAKEFGPDEYKKLDPITVSMRHPDALTALLSPASEITTHFASQPFIAMEAANPGIRQIVSSTEILGGPLSFNVLATSTKFHDANPKLYKAFMTAFAEATDWVNANKREAAELYLRVSKDKSSVDEVMKIVNAPDTSYTLAPKGLMPVVEFMKKTGAIKVAPATWQEMFFPEAHGMPGS
jgi:NitT/TauT family transport system substrate-binding protein